MKKLLYLLTILFIFSCKKEESNPIQIRLTDAAGDFKEVNIELKEVQVKMYNEDWVNLITNRGVYNLLDFTNGKDTLIAYGTIPDGTIKEIRFSLGASNSVKLINDSIAYLHSNHIELMREIRINRSIKSDLDILIDFDAGQSVHFEKDSFKLNPVLTLIQ